VIKGSGDSPHYLAANWARIALSTVWHTTIRTRLAQSRTIRGKATTHLHHNPVGRPIYVRCGEPEQAKAGANQVVLSAVVLNQPIAVIATVIFDCQALIAIKQIWTAYDTASLVIDGNLNLRPWESGKHEQHP
jgi:hypothetical protein